MKIEDVEIGMKVKDGGGNEYTIEKINIHNGRIKFEGYNYFVPADNYKQVNKFQVGDEARINKYNEKLEVRGFKKNGNPIVEDNTGSVFSVDLNKLSPLKNPDELEVGDKFKDTLGDINEILFTCKDEHYKTMAYTCKKDCGLITINNPIEVKEIIYD